MEYGLISCLSKNIKDSKEVRKLWRKDALWSLSNVITCGIDAIQEILRDENVLDRIIDRYYNDPIDVKYLLSGTINPFIVGESRSDEMYE